MIKQIGFSLLILANVSAWGAGLNSNSDATVTDFDTGLIWQQQSAHGKNWNDANASCNSLTLAGKNDWRLPTIKELFSLVDYRRKSPAIYLPNFPDMAITTISWDVWTASTLSDNSSNAWIIYFGLGTSIDRAKTSINSVRCVRGKQS